MTSVQDHDIENRAAVHSAHRQLQIKQTITCKYQPIIDPFTGQTYGVESLVSGLESLGVSSMNGVHDAGCDPEFHKSMEAYLHQKAMAGFQQLALDQNVLLYLNLDKHRLDRSHFDPKVLHDSCRQYGIDPAAICLEISERPELNVARNPTGNVMERAKRQSFSVAIDHFGTGYAGLRVLFDSPPDFIKIDRFFIEDVDKVRKKRLFVREMISLAQTLGIRVIANGVESEREFQACKELGFNLVQGTFLQAPVSSKEGIAASYNSVLTHKQKRETSKDRQFINQELESIPAIPVDIPLIDVFDWFRRNKNLTFFPIVNKRGEPLGIVREEDLKDFTYSKFGKELLSNTSFKRSVTDFIIECPIADIRDDAERIIEKFTMNETKEGIMVVDNMHYVGFLSASSMLRVVNEKHLAMASDQNPLSKLPGNKRVMEYLTDAIESRAQTYTVVYFDFDNFKPFNDTYGFRLGDRAILLFADILRKELLGEGIFLGHVGGDDFFAGIKTADLDGIQARVAHVAKEFKHQAETFYEKNHRDAGGIIAKDREGNERFFPLLTVSCAVLHLVPRNRDNVLESTAHLIADLKKNAKDNVDGISVASLM